MDRRPQAGEATAHDADIGTLVALKGRSRCRAALGGKRFLEPEASVGRHDAPCRPRGV